MTRLDERTRAWIYRVATAVIPLLVLVGLATEDVAQQVLLIVAAVLAVGEGALASVNTSAVKPRDDGHGGDA